MSQETNSAPVTENKMGTMPIGRLVFNMSLPMMISMLVQALYNIVDSIFVAKLSENALTAVSLAFPLQTLIIAVATGTGVGVNALLSKSLGAHKYDEANKIGINGAVLYAFSYVIFLILGLTIVKPFYMSQIGNADVEIMDMGVSYLSTVMIFSFGIFAEIFFERVLTSTGRTIFSMTSQLCGAITNIILDPIMIFGLLGFPKLGATGAAVATVVGQCVAAVVAFVCNHKFNHDIKLSFKGYSPDFKIMGTIYAIGIPSIIMQSIGSVMTYSMNRILIGFSSTAAAVFGVYFKLQTFLYLPASGIVQGMRPILSFNYGAGEKKRMKQILSVCTGLIFGILMVGTALFLLLPEPIMGMFSKDGVTIREGAAALRIISLGFVVSGISVVASGALEALGEGIPSFIISLLRYLVLIVPVASIGSRIFGITGVWGAFPVAEVLTAAVSAGIFTARYRACLKRL